MLPFIPRKVAKSLNQKAVKAPTTTEKKASAPESSSHARSVQLAVTEEPASAASRSPATTSFKGKEKASQNSCLSDEDYAVLLRLAVSDYALWSDTDLRRTIEFAEDGYFPLLYIIDRLSLSDGTTPSPSETTLVKAIRAHASDVFEVRMLVSSPSRAPWYGRNMAQRDTVGGYEIRLKDWRAILDRVGNSTRQEWEARTIYIENVPPQFRAVADISRFVSKLLQEKPSDCDQNVQRISLPRHHLDKPDARLKCKGFALVTLARMEDVDFLVQRWPWQRHTEKSADASDNLSQDAARFGFRTTQKSHWDDLNAEYLAYRQKLLDELASTEQSEQAATEPSRTSKVPAMQETIPEPHTSQTSVIDLSAPYPPGCLAYTRNVHLETNKTTLRKLFSHAFVDSCASAAGGGIDYVDFNKGMDTCHLRLAAPSYTQELVRYFSERRIVQKHGLDGVGTEKADQSQKPLTVEAVSGEREELYWGKVPEKVRRQAVEKAVSGSSPSQDVERNITEEGHRGPKRKRRRMN